MMLIRAVAVIFTVLFIVNSVGSFSADLREIRDGEACEEGKVYRHKCNTCKCKKHSLMCTKMACFDFSIPDILRQQSKERKAFKRSKTDTAKQLDVSETEFHMLPKLPHYAADCTPNKKYKVDCNVCICNQHRNLECDNEMCVDQKTTRNLEVKKSSGKPCTKDFETKKCVKCKCISGETECEPMVNCQMKKDIILSKGAGSIHRLSFNYLKDECVPGVAYKVKCNKCYCQPDKSLQCTNKVCLNHEQTLQLDEQREYLVEHGS